MTVRIINSDCREALKTLPDESVHCVVTSPPYWGLRDYGTATWEGGDHSCDHLGAPMRTNNKPTDRGATFHGGTSRATEPMGRECSKCGARRIDSQLGLEPTPAEYVEHMVAVFREVRRVLRADGTLWLNLGDSYGSRGGDPYSGFNSRYHGTDAGGKQAAIAGAFPGDVTLATGLKPKDLCGIPWRVAFALQADGWWLRQDIIWHKPNPMPESVTDRCTKAHEYVFLLAKSDRYYFDAAAISEEFAGAPYAGRDNGAILNGDRADRGRTIGMTTERRNKRSVWTVTTKPFTEAHFATFPPALIEPCIKAGCPEGGTVLDPFGGAGTTGLVADRFQRNAILIELNPEYAEMARRRISGDAPLFADVA